MPPEYQRYVQQNGERFIHWSEEVSSHTQVVAYAILGTYVVERYCMGLLKLAAKYTPELLGNTSERALEYTLRSSLKNIHTILASGWDKVVSELSATSLSSA